MFHLWRFGGCSGGTTGVGIVPDVNLYATTTVAENLAIGIGRAVGRELITIQICVMAAANEVVADRF